MALNPGLVAQSQRDFFRLLALCSCAISIASILFLAISMPIFYMEMDEQRVLAARKSKQFQEKSNQIWTKIKSSDELIPYTSRRERYSSPDEWVCEGCNQLNCQPGPAGLPGESGEYGPPGQPGGAGLPGIDGFDIEMAPEQLDLPCSVCPAGPPGLRGNQGERGHTGLSGVPGMPGEAGRVGIQGPHGASGPAGNPGQKGEPGFQGQAGDSVVAGIGIKGQRGKEGPVGIVGAVGLPGKRSKVQGKMGSPGKIGLRGEAGVKGGRGQQGEIGSPGEPGEPATYCPSDCGISHIKIPAFNFEQMQHPIKAENEHETEYEDDELMGLKGSDEMKMTSSTPIEQLPRTKEEKRGGVEGIVGMKKKPQEMRRHPTGGYYHWQR